MVYAIQELYIIKTAPSNAFNALQENVSEAFSISCILRYFYFSVIFMCSGSFGKRIIN